MAGVAEKCESETRQQQIKLTASLVAENVVANIATTPPRKKDWTPAFARVTEVRSPLCRHKKRSTQLRADLFIFIRFVA